MTTLLTLVFDLRVYHSPTCPYQVLKPGVEDVVTTDMNFVYLMSRYLEFIQPEASRLSLTGVMGKRDSGAMWVGLSVA